MVNIFGKDIVPVSDPQVKIQDVLEAYDKKNDVQFIQVGASDGLKNDYIHDKVVNHGWSGILIEPVPKSFKQLSNNYRGLDVFLENVAISDKSGEFPFFVGKVPSVSSFNKKHDPLKVAKKIMVPTLTLNQVITKRLFFQFDLLQIDAESYDFRVIKSIDLSKYAPRIIHYEHRHLGDEKIACEKHLQQHGYTLYFNRNNTIATK